MVGTIASIVILIIGVLYLWVRHCRHKRDNFMATPSPYRIQPGSSLPNRTPRRQEKLEVTVAEPHTTRDSIIRNFFENVEFQEYLRNFFMQFINNDRRSDLGGLETSPPSYRQGMTSEAPVIPGMTSSSDGS